MKYTEQLEVMRTTVKLTMTQYGEIKKIAGNIGVPISTLVSMLLGEALLSDKVKISKRKKNKNERYKEIEISISVELRNRISDIIEEQCPNYTLREMAMDVIDYKISERGKLSIYKELSVKEKVVSDRILHAENADYTKTKKNMPKYSEETKKEYKGIFSVDIYVERLAEAWGVPKKSIEKYFVAKQVERLVKKYDKEIDRFHYDNTDEFI